MDVVCADGDDQREGLVNDGLDAACHNNGRTTWSYNQGVVLGGLTALGRADHKADRMAAAKKIATAAVTKLVDADGVLHDAKCEPACGEDAVQFKGIFARNLAELQAVAKDAGYSRFLKGNGDSLWEHARTADDRFGVVWSGPATAGNAGAQISALDALVAAAAQR